jgi:Tfp pilus assembly protein FimT
VEANAFRGITLSSLFAVAMIIGIESVVALPRINDAIKHYRLNNAAGTLWQDMHMARTMAIKEKRAVRIIFDHTSYRIVRVDTGEVALSRPLSIEYPEIDIVVTESRGGIVFDRTGSAEGGPKEIEIIGPTGSRRFTILPTGKISRLS